MSVLSKQVSVSNSWSDWVGSLLSGATTRVVDYMAPAQNPIEGFLEALSKDQRAELDQHETVVFYNPDKNPNYLRILVGGDPHYTSDGSGSPQPKGTVYSFTRNPETGLVTVKINADVKLGNLFRHQISQGRVPLPVAAGQLGSLKENQFGAARIKAAQHSLRDVSDDQLAKLERNLEQFLLNGLRVANTAARLAVAAFVSFELPNHFSTLFGVNAQVDIGGGGGPTQPPTNGANATEASTTFTTTPSTTTSSLTKKITEAMGSEASASFFGTAAGYGTGAAIGVVGLLLLAAIMLVAVRKCRAGRAANKVAPEPQKLGAPGDTRPAERFDKAYKALQSALLGTPNLQFKRPVPNSVSVQIAPNAGLPPQPVQVQASPTISGADVWGEFVQDLSVASVDNPINLTRAGVAPKAVDMGEKFSHLEKSVSERAPIGGPLQPIGNSGEVDFRALVKELRSAYGGLPVVAPMSSRWSISREQDTFRLALHHLEIAVRNRRDSATLPHEAAFDAHLENLLQQDFARHRNTSFTQAGFKDLLEDPDFVAAVKNPHEKMLGSELLKARDAFLTAYKALPKEESLEYRFLAPTLAEVSTKARASEAEEEAIKSSKSRRSQSALPQSPKAPTVDPSKIDSSAEPTQSANLTFWRPASETELGGNGFVVLTHYRTELYQKQERWDALDKREKGKSTRPEYINPEHRKLEELYASFRRLPVIEPQLPTSSAQHNDQNAKFEALVAAVVDLQYPAESGSKDHLEAAKTRQDAYVPFQGWITSEVLNMRQALAEAHSGNAAALCQCIQTSDALFNDAKVPASVKQAWSDFTSTTSEAALMALKAGLPGTKNEAVRTKLDQIRAAITGTVHSQQDYMSVWSATDNVKGWSSFRLENSFARGDKPFHAFKGHMAALPVFPEVLQNATPLQKSVRAFFESAFDMYVYPTAKNGAGDKMASCSDEKLKEILDKRLGIEGLLSQGNIQDAVTAFSALKGHLHDGLKKSFDALLTAFSKVEGVTVDGQAYVVGPRPQTAATNSSTA
jgi:hypothetical protein